MQEALNTITECAKTGKGNLLELAVNAARERATVGEITQAMEAVSILIVIVYTRCTISWEQNDAILWETAFQTKT